jgi:hypothetical protein
LKLACCLVASDLNPAYLHFFPLVHRVWTELVGIDVRLVLIGHELPPALNSFNRLVHVFPPVPGVHPAFQAQCIRLLFPALLGGEYTDAVLISDMDMIPMNRRYFTRPIEHLTPDKFVVYRAGVLEALGEIPICYNAATPGTWGEMFENVRDETDISDVLRQWWAECGGYEEIRKGAGWTTDQRRLFSRLNAWAAAEGSGRVVRLTDRQTGFCRLDRCSPEVFRRRLARHSCLLRAGYYADFHMMQPAHEHGALNLQAADEALRPASPTDRMIVTLMPLRYKASAVHKLIKGLGPGLFRM